MRWYAPLVDEATGDPSASKIGVIVCFTLISVKFWQIPAGQLSVDMVLAYGALGGLHNALILFIKRKYPCVDDSK